MKVTTREEGVANWVKMQEMAAAAEANDPALAKRACRYERDLIRRQQRSFAVSEAAQ